MRQFIIAMISLCLIATPGDAQGSSATHAQACVSIMGDSLPAGTFVAMLPGTGVTVLEAQSFASVLDEAFHAREWFHIGIYDLSLSASAIASNATLYQDSPQFHLGRELNCLAVLVFPFFNDLYALQNTDMPISLYQSQLETFLTDIQINSPHSRIYLLDFYYTRLQGAGPDTYGNDISFAQVQSINAIHEGVCRDREAVNCVSLLYSMRPVENYVVGAISPTMYATAGYRPLRLEDQTMLDNYWAHTPNGDILGDGLHLNPLGQATIAEMMTNLWAISDPVNFAPLLP